MMLITKIYQQPLLNLSIVVEGMTVNFKKIL